MRISSQKTIFDGSNKPLSVVLTGSIASADATNFAAFSSGVST